MPDLQHNIIEGTFLSARREERTSYPVAVLEIQHDKAQYNKDDKRMVIIMKATGKRCEAALALQQGSRVRITYTIDGYRSREGRWYNDLVVEEIVPLSTPEPYERYEEPPPTPREPREPQPMNHPSIMDEDIPF